MTPCVLGCWSREDGNPFAAAPGWVVCHQCADRLAEVLSDIGVEYRSLMNIHNLIPHGSGGDGVRTVPGSKSPAVDAILVHSDPRSAMNDQPSALADVAEWAKTIRADRSLDLPPNQMLASVPRGRITMKRELETIRFNWDWILGQEWVPDFAAEMRGVLAALRAVAGLAPKVLQIGTCPMTVRVTFADGSTMDNPCGQRLRVRVGDTEIRCVTCGHVWSRSEWTKLGNSSADYALLSESFKVSVRTLQRWAGEDGWVKTGSPRRPLMAVSEVLSSYVKRRGQLPLQEAG